MSGAIPKGLPCVFDYDDYRRFLRDDYAARKRADPRWSYGVFARRAGLASRTYLKLVADGDRDIAPATARRFAAALRLGSDESRCFALLVAWNQSKDPASREKAHGELRRWKVVRSLRTLEPEALKELLDWACYLVLGLSKVEGFRADPAWIRRRLARRITAAQARKALDRLSDRGYLRVRKGRLADTRAGTLYATTADGPRFDAREISQRLRAAAMARADAVQRGRHRGYSGSVFLNPLLTEAEARDLLRKIKDLLFEQVDPARRGAKGELYSVVLDLFPLSDPLATRR